MLSTVIPPANGVRASRWTSACSAGPAPAITIRGRAWEVDDVVGERWDGAVADMCRPFREVAGEVAWCLISPA